MHPTLDAVEAPLARGPLERILGWAIVMVIAPVAVLSATFAVALMPPILHSQLSWRYAAAFGLAGPGNYLMTLYAGRAARARVASLIPALLWVVTVFVFVAGRPEGDTAYLLASYQGLLLAPVGMVAAAVGTVRAARHPWPLLVRRVQAPPETADS